MPVGKGPGRAAMAQPRSRARRRAWASTAMVLRTPTATAVIKARRALPSWPIRRRSIELRAASDGAGASIGTARR